MKEIEAYVVYNKSGSGPLSGIYPEWVIANGEMKEFSTVKCKPYSCIWDAFVELEKFSKGKRRRNLVFPHDQCTGAPCYNPGNVEYRLIDTKAERKPKYIFPNNPFGDFTYVDFTEIGGVITHFSNYAVSVARFCRYTIYADSEIPLDMVRDIYDFSQMLEKEETLKQLRIYCIAEKWIDQPRNNNRIIYTDTKIWSEIPGD